MICSVEMIYLFNRRINLGPIEKDMMVSESEVELIEEYSKNLDALDLGIFWQLTIKTIDDLKILSNECLVLEMYVMQLMHLKKIAKPEKILEKSKSNIASSNFVKIPEQKTESKVNVHQCFDA